MKRVRFVCLSLLVAFTFLSCLSTPPVKPDAGAAPQAPANTPTTASDADQQATAPADIPAEGAVASSDSTTSSDEGLTPVEDAQAPELPQSEKLLYFYPEPDATLSAPEVKNSAQAEKPAVSKPAVPAPIPAPKAVEKAKPAVPAKASGVEKPKAKQSEKTQDKAASEAPSGAATAEIIPGIWKSEPTAPTQAAEKASAVPAIPRQPPSRQATLPAGQTLEVWYPGSGWVFLGDASAQNGLGYENRKLDKADTLFTFKALKPGNYILDFSRFDVLDDSFMQDSLAVTVTDEAPTRTGRIRAPDYRASAKSNSPAATAAPVPAGTPGSAVAAGPAGTVGTAAQNGNAPSQANTATGTTRGGLSQPQAGSSGPLSPARGTNAPMSDEPTLTSPMGGLATQGSAATDIPSDPDAILKKAQSSLASGDAAGALSLLDAFFTTAVSSLDEGWYLRGQAYESNGASRDIRKALDAYQILVQAYPDSPRWKAADERIRYIKQFYQKIR